MNQCEHRISYLTKRFTISNHEKKDFITIARNHEKSMQELLDDTKKNIISLIVVSEKAADYARIF